MEIERVKYPHSLSCNACHVGDLDIKNNTITYPHNECFYLKFHQMLIRLCPKCFEDLKELMKDFKPSETTNPIMEQIKESVKEPKGDSQ